MTNYKDEHKDLPALLGKMLQTVRRVDKDDLAGLAKLHSWCETLLQQRMLPDSSSSAGAGKLVKTSITLLESIILGEAVAPQAALNNVVQQITEMAGLLGITADSSEPPTPSNTNVSNDTMVAAARQVSDAEIETKLANVFDEEPLTVTTGTAGETGSPALETGHTAKAAVSAEVPEILDAVEVAPTVPSSASQSSPTIAPEPAPELNTVAEEKAEGTAPPAYVQEPLRIDLKELEFVKGFVEEAREHMETIETAVLGVERSPEDRETIDNLFRPFHTIKGMAGFLNLRDINGLTHEVETLLDQARKGQRKITSGVIDLVLDVVDVLKSQIAAVAVFVADPKADEVVPQPPIGSIIAKLRDVVAGRIEPEGRLPSTGDLASPLGKNLVDQGACAKEVVDFALQEQQKDPTKKTGEILMDMGAVTARQVAQALRVQKVEPASAATSSSRSVAGDQSVRIDTAKLDSLVDMVGELVIAQTLVNANPLIATDPKLSKDASQVAKIVRDVQEVAMGMRMIPIGPTFQKMARLVRDVSRKAGKQVELHISGEETELDKNVIQQISDPLIHMVRNAVDHGVESPTQRKTTGKAELGHVYLSAFHQGGNIVIEIRDDGKGLDPKKLIAKGIEKGLITPGEELTDEQAYNLIFAPGFSTAEKITDISGRGVGMDVVRRNIEALRGKTEIHSVLGQGTTFSIRLPLTLAIIDGMVIKVGQERFIIPTIAIEQALRPQRSQISSIQCRGEVLNVRGRLIPLIQLGDLFGLTHRVDPCEAMVVIAHCEGRQIGLVVGELIGQQQVVIKTLGERFERLKGIAGAAILGDGRVGLILEMSGIASAHQNGNSVAVSSKEQEKFLGDDVTLLETSDDSESGSTTTSADIELVTA